MGDMSISIRQTLLRHSVSRKCIRKCIAVALVQRYNFKYEENVQSSLLRIALQMLLFMLLIYSRPPSSMHARLFQCSIDDVDLGGR